MGFRDQVEGFRSSGFGLEVLVVVAAAAGAKTIGELVLGAGSLGPLLEESDAEVKGYLLRLPVFRFNGSGRVGLQGINEFRSHFNFFRSLINVNIPPGS